MKKKTMALCGAALALAGACMILDESPAHAQDKGPVELGEVKWTRDLEAALKASKKSGKPVFAFFQEVPG